MAKMTNAIDSPSGHGTALAKLRWSKATPAERAAVGKMLVEARRKKGKVRSKRGRKAAAN